MLESFLHYSEKQFDIVIRIFVKLVVRPGQAGQGAKQLSFNAVVLEESLQYDQDIFDYSMCFLLNTLSGPAWQGSEQSDGAFFVPLLENFLFVIKNVFVC